MFLRELWTAVLDIAKKLCRSQLTSVLLMPNRMDSTCASLCASKVEEIAGYSCHVEGLGDFLKDDIGVFRELPTCML
jgi:hypothetical protein